MTEDTEATFTVKALSQIVNSGRALEKLHYIADMEVFESLSKHDPFWYGEKVCQDRLYNTRIGLVLIHDKILDIIEMLEKFKED